MLRRERGVCGEMDLVIQFRMHDHRFRSVLQIFLNARAAAIGNLSMVCSMYI